MVSAGLVVVCVVLMSLLMSLLATSYSHTAQFSDKQFPGPELLSCP